MRQRLERWRRSIAGLQGRARPLWLRIALQSAKIAVIGLSLYYLGHMLARGAGQVDWRTIRFRAAPLLAALGLTSLCVALGGWAWQILLAGMGYRLSLKACLGIQTTSNLAKYLPGYAWQLLGKAYLTRREGVPGSLVALAVAFELGSLLATALLVALLAMPNAAALPVLGSVSLEARGALVAAILLALALSPWLLGHLAALVCRRASGDESLIGAHSVERPPPAGLPTGRRRSLLRMARIWAAQGVMLVAWVLFGLGFGCIALALQPLNTAEWLLAVYALAISFLASLLVLFVPIGIGVREGVMAFALGTHLPGSVAVAVAVLSRLILTLSELLAFGLVRAWHALGRSASRSRDVS